LNIPNEFVLRQAPRTFRPACAVELASGKIMLESAITSVDMRDGSALKAI
jgi:hypothetical protein